MKLTIVRHGQTNYNVLGLLNSDPAVDVFLTEVGVDEAKRTAEQLRDEPFDAIFISELPRTKQTAEYINKYHNLHLVADKRLDDIDTGFEGEHHSVYHAERDTAPDPFTYRHGNSESSEDVYNRVQSFLDDLKKTEFRNILIVTSRHNFRHFRNIIDHLDPRESLKHDIPNVEILIREV